MSTSRRELDLSLYLVTDALLCSPRSVPEVVGQAVAGGVTAVQVRDKQASRRELLEQVRAVQAALAEHPGRGDRPRPALLVNDAVDVAQLAGADGVHLGQDDLPVGEVRGLTGPHMLLGLSIGCTAEAQAATDLPPGTVDYWGLAPVWTTPTKPDAAAPLGLDRLRALVAIAHRTGVPAAAIGGIDPERVTAVRRTGVDGVCVVSAICAAPDPRAAAAQLLP